MRKHLLVAVAFGLQPAIDAFVPGLGDSNPMFRSASCSSGGSTRVIPWSRGGIVLAAKKKGGKPKGGTATGRKPQQKQEAKQKQEQRFDAVTRQYMFTMLKVTKKAPGGKEILKDVSLSFYPGAKIGVVGLNGAGKSTLLRIMSGEDEDIDGTARPLPGASIGFLKQEPELTGTTVTEAIEPALAKSRAILENFGELSAKLAEPLSDDEMAAATHASLYRCIEIGQP